MWPFQPKMNNGFIQDTFDPRDVWVDEIFGGEIDLPKKFKTEFTQFEEQGLLPYCVTMSCIAETQRKYKNLFGKEIKLSQPHTFYNAGGTPQGSSIRDNLDWLAKNGANQSKDMPLVDVYDLKPDWFSTLRKTALSIPSKDTQKIPGYARVQTDEQSLKRAVIQFGAVIVPVAVDSNFRSDKAKRTSQNDNHVILYTGYDDELAVKHTFDSLMWKTQGEHDLDASYNFNSAYVIGEFPQNWKEIVQTSRSDGFENVLNHYGQKGNWDLENTVAGEMLKQFKAFNNQSVLEAAGRFWTVYINAVAYGGYTYRDVINSCYNWRRTGHQLFDFNHETRQQWYNRVKGLINNR